MIQGTRAENLLLKPLFYKKEPPKEKSFLQKAGNFAFEGIKTSSQAVRYTVAGVQKTIKTLSPQSFPEWFCVHKVLDQVNSMKTNGLNCSSYISFSALLNHGAHALYEDLIKEKEWSYFLSLNLQERQSFVYDLYQRAVSLSSETEGPNQILKAFKTKSPNQILEALNSFLKAVDIDKLHQAASTHPEIYDQALDLTKTSLLSKVQTFLDQITKQIGSEDAANTLIKQLGDKINNAKDFDSVNAALKSVSEFIDKSDLKTAVLNSDNIKSTSCWEYIPLVQSAIDDNNQAVSLKAYGHCQKLASNYYFSLFYLSLFTALVGFRIFSNAVSPDSEKKDSENKVTYDQFKKSMETFQDNMQQLLFHFEKKQESKLENIIKNFKAKSFDSLSPEEKREKVLELLSHIKKQKNKLKHKYLK